MKSQQPQVEVVFVIGWMLLISYHFFILKCLQFVMPNSLSIHENNLEMQHCKETKKTAFLLLMVGSVVTWSKSPSCTLTKQTSRALVTTLTGIATSLCIKFIVTFSTYNGA